MKRKRVATVLLSFGFDPEKIEDHHFLDALASFLRNFSHPRGVISRSISVIEIEDVVEEPVPEAKTPSASVPETIIPRPRKKKRKSKRSDSRSAPGWTQERQDDAGQALSKYVGASTSTKISQKLTIDRAIPLRLARGQRLGKKTIGDVVRALKRLGAPRDLIEKFDLMLRPIEIDPE